MLKLLDFFRHVKNIIEFTHLPKTQKRIVFYSEGKTYWVHLESLVKEMLASTDINICYISSNDDDPGLQLKHENYNSFKIDEGFIRNWLFENIEAGVFVMTMPDLQQYQVKRSKFDVHYVYVQHSLVSLHMVYREGAFDFFDTIFCAGRHHLYETRAMEAQWRLPEKNLVEHGYARLDSIINQSDLCLKNNGNSEKKHVLIAPSWGKQGTIETGLAEIIIGQLLMHSYKVTLRPHPQTIKFFKGEIDAILENYNNNTHFLYEGNVAEQDSLHSSDIMISDWSGAALDYAFGLKKPVLFIDVPRKVNNKAYEDVEIIPLEVKIREKIGEVLPLNDISKCYLYVDKLLTTELNINVSEYVFNVGNSAKVGCAALRYICDEV